MNGLCCKRCSGTKDVKRGFGRGLQRYLCKDCGCHFTATAPRGKPAAMKALAVLLYAMGNASLGMIARLLGVSSVAVYKWIRQQAEAVPEPSATSSAGLVQIDERWHFVNGKKTRFGSGGPMILFSGEPWPGNWGGVMMRASQGSSTKAVSKGTAS